MHNIIEINNLSKKYDLYKKNWHVLSNIFPESIKAKFFSKLIQEKWVFRNLNLTISRGERIGIIGENGTGKSTLLKMICKHIQPTSGSIRVEGKIHSLLNMGAGFYHSLNAYENIAAYFALFNTKVAPNSVAEIIDFSELGAYASQPLKTYSSGMFARFAFAVMTEINPDILIIDEILGAGDAYFMGKCVERLNGLCDKTGMTLLLVSHDMQSVQKLCDKGLWIHKGEIKSQGDVLDVSKEYLMHMRNKNNIRLMARDQQIPKDFLQNNENIENITLRFVSKDTSDKNQVRMYKIKATLGSFEIDCANIGKSFDNDVTQGVYIVESKSITDWGKSEKDDSGYYRTCINNNSKYKHAPFIICLPVGLKEFHSNLNIEFSFKANAAFVMEVYSRTANKYIKLYEYLPDGEFIFITKSISFDISDIEKEDGEQPAETIAVDDKIQKTEVLSPAVEVTSTEEFDYHVNDIDQYGSKEIIISRIQILDENNHETRILESDKSYSIKINYETREKINNPSFVFAIYTPDGTCVTQFLEKGEDLNLKTIEPGKGAVHFYIPKLMIGAMDYIASAAIFKHSDELRIEPDAYHVLDRCIPFKVENPNFDYEKGICIQPYFTKSKMLG
jgi:homopolymeric O-antigen transport system ATP-binding protein